MPSTYQIAEIAPFFITKNIFIDKKKHAMQHLQLVLRYRRRPSPHHTMVQGQTGSTLYPRQVNRVLFLSLKNIIVDKGSRKKIVFF